MNEKHLSFDLIPYSLFLKVENEQKPKTIFRYLPSNLFKKLQVYKTITKE